MSFWKGVGDFLRANAEGHQVLAKPREKFDYLCMVNEDSAKIFVTNFSQLMTDEEWALQVSVFDHNVHFEHGARQRRAVFLSECAHSLRPVKKSS